MRNGEKKKLRKYLDDTSNMKIEIIYPLRILQNNFYKNTTNTFFDTLKIYVVLSKLNGGDHIVLELK